VQALQAAYRKKEAESPRKDALSAGQIRRLGLLEGPLEEKDLKAPKWLPHRKDNMS